MAAKLVSFLVSSDSSSLQNGYRMVTALHHDAGWSPYRVRPMHHGTDASVSNAIRTTATNSVHLNSLSNYITFTVQ